MNANKISDKIKSAASQTNPETAWQTDGKPIEIQKTTSKK